MKKTNTSFKIDKQKTLGGKNYSKMDNVIEEKNSMDDEDSISISIKKEWIFIFNHNIYIIVIIIIFIYL